MDNSSTKSSIHASEGAASEANKSSTSALDTTEMHMSWYKEQFLSIWSSWKWYIVAGGVAIVILIYWYHYKKQSKERRRKEIDTWCARIPESETIFVSIATYRDPQCSKTLFDLFEKAACPFRISVGVCQQNVDGLDEDVATAYKLASENHGVHDFSHRIRYIKMRADEAKGPMYARYLIEQQLYRGEKYYLIVDSHMLFTPNWDVECIKMYNQCLQWSPKPVLTMYPEDFKAYQRTWTPSGYENESGSFLRFKKFNDKTGVIEIEGPRFKRKPTQPQMSLFWGGCFSFGSAQQIKEVPYDGHCPFVFIGEEISMAARLWTSGYDLYHPHRMVVYHMWKRDRPTFWQLFDDAGNELHKQRQALEKQGYQRIKTLLKMDPSTNLTIMAPFGLGTARSLEDYEKFIGIRLRNKEFIHLGGVLGLPVASTSADILNRFGTWSDYKKVQNVAGQIIRERQHMAGAMQLV